MSAQILWHIASDWSAHKGWINTVAKCFGGIKNLKIGDFVIALWWYYSKSKTVGQFV